MEKYVRSVNANGVSCSANTCGNKRVNQYIAQQAALIPGLGNQELREFGRRIAQATRWSPSEFRSAPAALRAGMIQGLPPSRQAGPTPRPATPAPRTAARRYVNGYQAQERVLELTSQTPLPKMIPLAYLLVVASLIALGAARELPLDWQDSRWLPPRCSHPRPPGRLSSPHRYWDG